MTGEDRLTEVEIRLAELERANEELSALATDQWKTIEALQRKVARLGERLEALAEQSGTDNPDVKPPHW